MKKIILIISIHALLPILTLGNVDLFQTSTDPAGRYKIIESGDVCKVDFLNYDNSDTAGDQEGCAYTWETSPDNYVFGAMFKNNLTQLLAIMADYWYPSNVVLSYVNEGIYRDYYFMSLSCDNLGIKMNNDSHFEGCPCKQLPPQKDSFWKSEYNKSDLI